MASDGRIIRWVFCVSLFAVVGRAILSTLFPDRDDVGAAVDDTTFVPRGKIGKPDPLLRIVTIGRSLV